MTPQDISNVSKVQTSLQRQLDDIKKLDGINSLILAVCLVDTLAGFYTGHDGKPGGNKKRFEKFVDKYLTTHKAYLYDLRCNLTHSFSNTVANFMFVDNKEFTDVFGSSLSIYGDPLFSINTFKSDLEIACNNYFNELVNNSEVNIQTNFQIRFNVFGILQESNILTVRNLKGELIKHVDQADTLPGLDLKIMRVDPTKFKQ